MCYNTAFLESRATFLAKRYGRQMNIDWKVKLDEFETTLPPIPPNASPEIITSIENIWDKQLENVSLDTYYNLTGFAHKPLPIIKHDGIFLYLWGLIPHDSEPYILRWDGTLNARSEEVFSTKSFRNAIVSQRCIVPVSCFFESFHLNKTDKIPYKISLPNEEMMSLAGIWDVYFDPESHEHYGTFAILTTDANPFMAKIHNSRYRMPVILSQEDEAKWIDPKLSKEEIQGLLKPYTGKLVAHTVSKIANSIPLRNQPAVLEPYKYKALPTYIED